jgi:Fe-S cluster assembly iron-binding protein IscA
MITLTENAQKKVHSILEGEGPDARLRMLVSGKGCAGLTYGFEITVRVRRQFQSYLINTIIRIENEYTWKTNYQCWFA